MFSIGSLDRVYFGLFASLILSTIPVRICARASSSPRYSEFSFFLLLEDVMMIYSSLISVSLKTSLLLIESGFSLDTLLLVLI